MRGTVLTFYSFKGGVGRSFILANIAVLLARWGHRVLVIDWDLEAPGLDRYFKPLIASPAAGVVDLVDDFRAGRSPGAHVTPVAVEKPGAVDLLAAGRRDTAYSRRVQEIDWEQLYEQGFAEFLEHCRAEWTAGYDFVLIDSRTGISDIGGICTAHLPDRLVVVFTANEQSMEAVDIAGRADVARDRMPYDRGQLTVLPILSRLDSGVEYQLTELWYDRCRMLTAPLFRNWLIRGVPVDLMLRHLTVPYVSYWSFGEKLAVLEEPTPSAVQISFALETLAAIVAHHFDRTELLADSRDAYVAEARAAARDFDHDLVVSTPRSARLLADTFVLELRSLGTTARVSLSGDPDVLTPVQDIARHLCLVVDEQVSRWQESEAEQFLRHTVADGHRHLFLVLTGSTDASALPSFLRQLGHLRLGDLREVAKELHASLLNEPTTQATPRDEAYQKAASALRGLPDRLPSLARWDVVGQTLFLMTEAVRADDPETLLTTTSVLKRFAPVGTGEVEPPSAVREAINRLVHKLDTPKDARNA